MSFSLDLFDGGRYFSFHELFIIVVNLTYCYLPLSLSLYLSLSFPPFPIFLSHSSLLSPNTTNITIPHLKYSKPQPPPAPTPPLHHNHHDQHQNTKPPPKVKGSPHDLTPTPLAPLVPPRAIGALVEDGAAFRPAAALTL